MLTRLLQSRLPRLAMGMLLAAAGTLLAAEMVGPIGETPITKPHWTMAASGIFLVATWLLLWVASAGSVGIRLLSAIASNPGPVLLAATGVLMIWRAIAATRPVGSAEPTPTEVRHGN